MSTMIHTQNALSRELSNWIMFKNYGTLTFAMSGWTVYSGRHQPMRVLNVLPTPPYHTRPNTAVHIILEQGLHPQKVAIHFTTIFLGGTRVGLFQRAESAPERICTQHMIDRHGFQLQCDFRQCHMHSGLLRFAMHDPEEIFSGISVVLTVAPPPPEPEAASLARQLEAPPSNSPHVQSDDFDESELMHVTSSSPRAPSPPPGDMQSTGPGLGFNHRITPAALLEFRQTLEWQARELDHRCGDPAQASFHVRSFRQNYQNGRIQNACLGSKAAHLAPYHYRQVV